MFNAESLATIRILFTWKITNYHHWGCRVAILLEFFKHKVKNVNHVVDVFIVKKFNYENFQNYPFVVSITELLSFPNCSGYLIPKSKLSRLYHNWKFINK